MKTSKAHITALATPTETRLFGQLSDDLVREFAQIAQTELGMDMNPQEARDMAQWLVETYTILLTPSSALPHSLLSFA